MECPICDATLYEGDSEWISDAEELFQAHCDNCGWEGSTCYVSTVEYYDYRTDAPIPSDAEGRKKWREENAKYYNAK